MATPEERIAIVKALSENMSVDELVRSMLRDYCGSLEIFAGKIIDNLLDIDLLRENIINACEAKADKMEEGSESIKEIIDA